MNLVKICGLQTSEMAIHAAAAGADLLGFIFASSRRQVTAKRVAAIIEDVRNAGYETPAVGVFVEPDQEQLERDIETSGIEYVQLSGKESSMSYSALGVPLIKAFPAGTDHLESDVRQSLADWSFAEYLMLDAHDPVARGGTGKLANWDLCRRLAADFPIMLAGGLTPANVEEAILTVRPLVVDVSSGVEINGAKDGDKIDRFVASARMAFARL